MTEQERMKQGYVWQDDDENMSLQAHTKALVRAVSYTHLTLPTILLV